MHSFFKHTHRHQAFTLITLMFGLAAHARTGSSITISGQPPTSVTAGQLYSFTPTVSGNYSKYVRYSIQNKPLWASFSDSSGTLSGVPSGSNVGTYSNIVITASTWRRHASLAPFSISVKSATVTSTPTTTAPTNTAPVITGIPAITGSVGKLYSFTPSASDADKDTLTFSIQNKPSWALFNTANGSLSGTPTAAAPYSNIVVSVSDGKTSTSLAAFSITISPPVLGSATIIWKAPTTNMDGTPLTNLAGFHVLYGTDPNKLSQKLDLPSATYSSAEIVDLNPGTYYFSVQSYTTSAMESNASPVVWKTIL